MKKVILSILIMVMVAMFASAVIAKKESGDLDPPLNPPNVTDVGDYICFDWDDVVDAVKYSVDVEVVVTNPGFEGTEVELSFGTSDREDGLPISLSELCVYKADFAFDLDDNPDTSLQVLTGTAKAKVKGLNSGKGKGRQNNPFSDWSDSFDL